MLVNGQLLLFTVLFGWEIGNWISYLAEGSISRTKGHTALEWEVLLPIRTLSLRPFGSLAKDSAAWSKTIHKGK